MAIGRLDANSEGLLLLTTDGKVSYHVCSSKVEKEYHVMIDGIITDEALAQLQMGVEIGLKGEKYMTKPGIAFRIDTPPTFPVKNMQIRDDRHGPTSWVGIVIREGKFRQVRKMTAAVGFPTLRLIRVRIGNIHLNDMPAGEVEEIDIMSNLD